MMICPSPTLTPGCVEGLPFHTAPSRAGLHPPDSTYSGSEIRRGWCPCTSSASSAPPAWSSPPCRRSSTYPGKRTRSPRTARSGSSAGRGRAGARVSPGLRLSAAIGVGLWPTELPFGVQMAIALLVADLGYYWLQRLYHRTALWRLHAL